MREPKAVGKQKGAKPAPYTAYTLTIDGSKRTLRARRIVIDVGEGRIQIDLTPWRPLSRGSLHVCTQGRALLKIGPGDGSSVELTPVPLRRRTRKSAGGA